MISRAFWVDSQNIIGSIEKYLEKWYSSGFSEMKNKNRVINILFCYLSEDVDEPRVKAFLPTNKSLQIAKNVRDSVTRLFFL